MSYYVYEVSDDGFRWCLPVAEGAPLERLGCAGLRILSHHATEDDALEDAWERNAREREARRVSVRAD